MATILGNKNLLDLPEPRPLWASPVASAAGASMAYDERIGKDSDPYLYLLASATSFYRYSLLLDGWIQLGSPALAGTFGAGATCVFHPTQGPRGTLAAGNTTSKVVLSTALPAAVGINQLSNRGDGVGYKIRIVDNVAGGSGRTEERYIVANTAGTTPTIWLDSALSFAPSTGATYEIISGRVFMLGAGAVAAGIFKYYDIATNSFSASLATTNLPATIANDSTLFDMSEANVPNSNSPGQGFFGALIATASAAGTLTGQASGGDSSVVANQFRNFQIRIAQDTTTPTSVGQRRRIASHTAGASPVYTLASNWTVTPSANAQFVVEYDDDKLLLWTSNVATTYTYNIASNAWDTTTFGAAGGVHAAGCMAFGAWAASPDVGLNSKSSMIHVFRGGSTAIVDVLDISGGANGTWDNAAVVGGGIPTFSTGSCGVYDPASQNAGRYAYINLNGGQQMVRYDLAARTFMPFRSLPTAQSTAITGGRMALCTFADGNTKFSALNILYGTGTNMYQIWLLN